MLKRRRPPICSFALWILTFQSIGAFDPCERFDLSQCDPAAECFSDMKLVPECRCPAGFVDMSSDPRTPGRKCQRVPVATRKGQECSPSDPLTCDSQKSEVCVLRDGRYQCDCRKGYGRLADGRCLLINECTAQPKMHDCAKEAECFDRDVGYECKCRSGLIDISPEAHRPGRRCGRKVNECNDPQRYGVDCDPDAKCLDTDEHFECRCLPGFIDVSVKYAKLPGRKCVEVLNECESPTLNSCHQNAQCEDTDDGYTCHCMPGFVDASADTNRFPGRICNRPTAASKPPETFPRMDQDLCDPNSQRACRPNEVCAEHKTPGTFTCDCASNAFRFRDGTCRLQSACETGNDCDRNANCVNVFDSYICTCKSGFYDVSPNPKQPGRKCRELINECALKNHTCSAFAICEDKLDGYDCKCLPNYVDSSAIYGLAPGPKNECENRQFNTCDDNADCIDTPFSYLCQCFPGFVDVSSSANLPPGRVCTLQSTCPKQKTDLVFLIDGSGSIGANVFRDEVLRFVREFIELFEIGMDNTRVGLIQYSDQIRHEFDLGQLENKEELKDAILQTEYLTGLTRTGAAIKHMTVEGFSERRGARPVSSDVSRVAIVITDGRSQDNVSQSSFDARHFSQINLFAVGVTDHVLPSELETIAGVANRAFLVKTFKDLDTRLRALIQKIACPLPTQLPSLGNRCEVGSQTGCNRELNELCMLRNGRPRCVCPPMFERHPLTNACGSPLCNPEVPTSCPSTETCSRTPFGTYRCVCANGYKREGTRGVCERTEMLTLVSANIPAFTSTCETGFELNPRTGRCILAGTCDPTDPESCAHRKREKCLLNPNGEMLYTCRCEGLQARHPILDICLSNECMTGENDCHQLAKCIDTVDSYLCECPSNYVDRSPDVQNNPGRVCVPVQNECLDGTHNCSPFALCIDTFEGFTCQCKKGYSDFSVGAPGRICKMQMDECSESSLNDCHPDAKCLNTLEDFTCSCLPGFADIDELRHPGRNCIKGNVNECKSPMLNRCSRNAVCIDEPNGYRCECNNGFVDKSSSGSFGFVCDSLVHPCNDPQLNDCAKEGGVCHENGSGYTCECKEPIYRDANPKKPGRVCVKDPCLNENRNDVKGRNTRLPSTEDPCHPQAICTHVDGNLTDYQCRCREGYEDRTPTGSPPGRVCVELVNECLNRALNDCDPLAVCEDLPTGFSCRCPLNSIDESPEQSKKGRKCRLTLNECMNPRLNNCSRFAECTDKLNGFECKCLAGYHDDNPNSPGTTCIYMINECESPQLNTCHENANCVDLPGAYECSCKENYYDESPNPLETGRVCLPLIDEKSANQLLLPTPSKIDGIPCGRQFCTIALNEVCAEGSHCSCRPGEARSDVKNKCERVTRTPLSVRVVEQDGRILRYSSQYGSQTNVPYVEFASLFTQGVEDALKSTVYGQRYVSSEVTLITHPKTVNSSWSDGLLVNFTVATKPSNTSEKCDLWEKFLQSTATSDHRLGSEGKLRLANDVEVLSPCVPPPNYCAGVLCDIEMGEVCIGGRCQVDYCLDVGFCPLNSTCVNLEKEAQCQCLPGFVDIRESNRRVAAGLPADVLCLRAADVNECALGLHNCSVIAQCIDHRFGYSCACPEGYVDGNPEETGRICAALLCDLCNQHGDCIPNPTTGNTTCACTEGWTGEFCEVAPSSAPLILLILLALLFLLLSLCCLLYFMSKCRCFQRVVPWNVLNETGESTGTHNSDLYTLAIPRAKLRSTPLPAHIDAGSLGSGESDFTLNENVERQVITEITRTEFHDDGNGDGGTLNTYHAINYGSPRQPIDDSRHPRPLAITASADSNQLSSAFGDSYRSFQGEQDDRSIESYATTEQRVYEPESHVNQWEPLRIGLIHELSQKRIPRVVMTKLQNAAVNLQQRVQVRSSTLDKFFDQDALQHCSPNVNFNSTAVFVMSSDGKRLKTLKTNVGTLWKHLNFLVIVQRSTKDCFVDELVMATAKPCNTIGTNRPLVARMSVCLNNRRWNNYKSAFDLFRHELLHALGFGMFTPIDSSAPPSKVIPWQNGRQTTKLTIHYMDFASAAIKFAQKHFACPKIVGIEADDEQKFHLNEYIFGNELMTPILADGPNYFTHLTASILESTYFGNSSWYLVNKKLIAEETSGYWYGRNFGCDFLEKSCYEVLRNRMSKKKQSSSYVFCSEKELWKTLRDEPLDICFSNGTRTKRYYGYCQMQTNVENPPISLNSAFPYVFRRTPVAVYGSTAIRRFCPIIDEIAAGSFHDLPKNSSLVLCV
ncbi:hypothetical protein M3Y96_01128600 [Aphelenchoides besseyi]|nr:hypothetical protein M3Y96_01128600 [Aphelenchoides besseyi]